MDDSFTGYWDTAPNAEDGAAAAPEESDAAAAEIADGEAEAAEFADEEAEAAEVADGETGPEIADDRDGVPSATTSTGPSAAKATAKAAELLPPEPNPKRRCLRPPPLLRPKSPGYPNID
jgi:hypothetical protein